MQDADVPIPYAVVHGLYYKVPPTLTAIESDFFSRENPTYASHGIHLGKNLRGNVYQPPRPLVGHGHHRYFYQIIALAKPLEGLKDDGAKYSEVLRKLTKENVIGWGEWVGHCERKPS